MASEKENHVVNGEDEEEEEKMEQFFALLRNFREARNRRKHELIQREQEEISKKKKKKNKISKLGDDGEKSSWVPSFEWEDFTAEIEFRRPSIIFPPSFNNKQEEKK
ncbi:hypothetical protein Gohar_012762, partial [Gossypium harknessii]|nr:hypothetical protein [Gossypium harknessii]